MSYRQCGVLVRYVSGALQQHQNLIYKRPSSLLAVKSYQDYKHQQERFYRNFGHKTQETPKISKILHLFVGVSFLIYIVDWGR